MEKGSIQEDPTMLIQSGNHFVSQGEMKRADELFDHASSIYLASPLQRQQYMVLVNNAAKLFYQAGDYKRASKWYKRLVAELPQNPQLMQTYINSKKLSLKQQQSAPVMLKGYRECLQLLREAINKFPSHAPFFSQSCRTCISYYELHSTTNSLSSSSSSPSLSSLPSSSSDETNWQTFCASSCQSAISSPDETNKEQEFRFRIDFAVYNVHLNNLSFAVSLLKSIRDEILASSSSPSSISGYEEIVKVTGFNNTKNTDAAFRPSAIDIMNALLMWTLNRGNLTMIEESFVYFEHFAQTHPYSSDLGVLSQLSTHYQVNSRISPSGLASQLRLANTFIQNHWSPTFIMGEYPEKKNDKGNRKQVKKKEFILDWSLSSTYHSVSPLPVSHEQIIANQCRNGDNDHQCSDNRDHNHQEGFEYISDFEIFTVNINDAHIDQKGLIWTCTGSSPSTSSSSPDNQPLSCAVFGAQMGADIRFANNESSSSPSSTSKTSKKKQNKKDKNGRTTVPIAHGILVYNQVCFNYYHWLIELLSQLTLSSIYLYPSFPASSSSSSVRFVLPQPTSQFMIDSLKLFPLINNKTTLFCTFLPSSPSSPSSPSLTFPNCSEFASYSSSSPPSLYHFPQLHVVDWRPKKEENTDYNYTHDLWWWHTVPPHALQLLADTMQRNFYELGYFQEISRQQNERSQTETNQHTLKLTPIIYLSRAANATSRKVMNEQKLIQRLTETYGVEKFQALNPATLSLFEQIYVFLHAQVLISPHGAALSNAIFLPYRTKRCAMIEFAIHPKITYYPQIAYALGISYHRVEKISTFFERSYNIEDSGVSAVIQILDGLPNLSPAQPPSPSPSPPPPHSSSSSSSLSFSSSLPPPPSSPASSPSPTSSPSSTSSPSPSTPISSSPSPRTVNKCLEVVHALTATKEYPRNEIEEALQQCQQGMSDSPDLQKHVKLLLNEAGKNCFAMQRYLDAAFYYSQLARLMPHVSGIPQAEAKSLASSDIGQEIQGKKIAIQILINASHVFPKDHSIVSQLCRICGETVMARLGSTLPDFIRGIRPCVQPCTKRLTHRAKGEEEATHNELHAVGLIKIAVGDEAEGIDYLSQAISVLSSFSSPPTAKTSLRCDGGSVRTLPLLSLYLFHRATAYINIIDRPHISIRNVERDDESAGEDRHYLQLTQRTEKMAKIKQGEGKDAEYRAKAVEDLLVLIEKHRDAPDFYLALFSATKPDPWLSRQWFFFGWHVRLSNIASLPSSSSSSTPPPACIKQSIVDEWKNDSPYHTVTQLALLKGVASKSIDTENSQLKISQPRQPTLFQVPDYSMFFVTIDKAVILQDIIILTDCALFFGTGPSIPAFPNPFSSPPYTCPHAEQLSSSPSSSSSNVVCLNQPNVIWIYNDHVPDNHYHLTLETMSKLVLSLQYITKEISKPKGSKKTPKDAVNNESDGSYHVVLPPRSLGNLAQCLELLDEVWEKFTDEQILNPPLPPRHLVHYIHKDYSKQYFIQHKLHIVDWRWSSSSPSSPSTENNLVWNRWYLPKAGIDTLSVIYSSALTSSSGQELVNSNIATPSIIYIRRDSSHSTAVSRTIDNEPQLIDYLNHQLHIYFKKNQPKTGGNSNSNSNSNSNPVITAVDPGQYSLLEQIHLFSKARLIIGPHGAGFTNLLFVSPSSSSSSPPVGMIEFEAEAKFFAHLAAARGFYHWTFPNISSPWIGGYGVVNETQMQSLLRFLIPIIHFLNISVSI